MKKSMLSLPFILAAAAILMFSSCKKESTLPTSNDSVSAQDQASIAGATDITSDDATAVAGHIFNYPYPAQPITATNTVSTDHWWRPLNSLLCGATITDTSSLQMVITYDGSSDCHGIIRSGSITVTLTNGANFSDMGAVLTITYNDVKVTDAETMGSYTINGTHTITNETGGLAWKIMAEITTGQTVTYRNQSSNMSITFANGSKRTWNVDRSRTWMSKISGNRNVITVMVSSANSGEVDTWGTNRFGETFTNSIPMPIAADNNVDCMWKPYEGKYVHEIMNRITTIVFGTNREGSPIGSPTVCGLGYYITYTADGKTKSRFVGYWH